MASLKIGIFGNGVLGQAMKTYFKEAKIYDKYRTQDPLAEVLAQDCFFICVPTPYLEGRGFDLTEVDDVFGQFKDLQGKIAVIRSTVIPGTTSAYQKKFPGLKILFNPEFLSEATAVEDFLNPDKQLVGYTEKSRAAAEEILNLLPKAPYRKIMKAEEAEMVKYMVNSYYALRVIFANQIYDICQASGINYNQVKEAFEADKRVGLGHFDVFHKGYRGYGGKCLRKDVDSLIDFAAAGGAPLPLLEVIKEINLKLNDRH